MNVGDTLSSTSAVDTAVSAPNVNSPSISSITTAVPAPNVNSPSISSITSAVDTAVSRPNVNSPLISSITTDVPSSASVLKDSAVSPLTSNLKNTSISPATSTTTTTVPDSDSDSVQKNSIVSPATSASESNLKNPSVSHATDTLASASASAYNLKTHFVSPVGHAPVAAPATPPSTAQSSPLKEEPILTRLQKIMMPAKDPGGLLSGGGISFLTGNKIAKFSYGYSSFKGKRSTMEDFYETRISEVDGQMVGFFGVFDGHGGSRTAEYLKNNLFKNLCSHPDFIKDTKSAIVEVFKQTDADYLNEENFQQKDAGSTATAAVLLGDRVLVANVGDSRVVASRAGSAIPLSIDHKPDRSDERDRIEQAGGFIVWAGTWRVGGVLAVSRAFGDKLLKPYVVAEPEIQEEELDGVDFIIIASDGLWNVLSNKDAVAIVQDITDAEAASRKLIEEAYAKGSSDNITCLVVRFKNP